MNKFILFKNDKKLISDKEKEKGKDNLKNKDLNNKININNNYKNINLIFHLYKT